MYYNVITFGRIDIKDGGVYQWVHDDLANLVNPGLLKLIPILALMTSLIFNPLKVKGGEQTSNILVTKLYLQPVSRQ